jgi:hypothetical protein
MAKQAHGTGTTRVIVVTRWIKQLSSLAKPGAWRAWRSPICPRSCAVAPAPTPSPWRCWPALLLDVISRVAILSKAIGWRVHRLRPLVGPCRIGAGSGLLRAPDPGV